MTDFSRLLSAVGIVNRWQMNRRRIFRYRLEPLGGIACGGVSIRSGNTAAVSVSHSVRFPADLHVLVGCTEHVFTVSVNELIRGITAGYASHPASTQAGAGVIPGCLRGGLS